MLPFNFWEKRFFKGAAVEDIALKGSISISTPLPARSSYTEEIDLGDTYSAAIIQFQVPQGAWSPYRKYGTTCMVGSVTSDATARSNRRESFHMGCGCFVSSLTYRFYMYQNDSKLSDNYFGSWSTGNYGPVRLLSAYIDDTILKLTFQNTHSIWDSNINIDGRFIAWKV